MHGYSTIYWSRSHSGTASLKETEASSFIIHQLQIACQLQVGLPEHLPIQAELWVGPALFSHGHGELTCAVALPCLAKNALLLQIFP